MQHSLKPQIALVLLSLLLLSCSNTATNKGSNPAQEPKKVDIALDNCSFKTFDPGESQPSDSSKTLLNKLGTGVLKQKGGSFVNLECSDGNSHVGWINSEGSPVSAIHGLGFKPSTYMYSYVGNSGKLRLMEKRSDGWYEFPGPFNDLTAPLPSGSKATTASYCMFPNAPVSEYSTRLLKYFGIGIAGRESTVRLKMGDYSGTGIVDSSGNLKVTDESGWSEQNE